MKDILIASVFVIGLGASILGGSFVADDAAKQRHENVATKRIGDCEYVIFGDLHAAAHKGDCDNPAHTHAAIGSPMPNHLDPDAALKRWVPHATADGVFCTNCNFRLPLAAPKPDRPRALLYPRCPQCGAQIACEVLEQHKIETNSGEEDELLVKNMLAIERAYIVTDRNRRIHCSHCRADVTDAQKPLLECPSCTSEFHDVR